jgi:hypothetical protein
MSLIVEVCTQKDGIVYKTLPVAKESDYDEVNYAQFYRMCYV